MLHRHFIDALTVLNGLQQSDLEAVGAIEPGDTGAWVDFTRDRARWTIHANPVRSERLWSLVDSRLSDASIADDAADDLHTLQQLAQDFGWDGHSSLWAWLKEQLTAARQTRAGLRVTTVTAAL